MSIVRPNSNGTQTHPWSTHSVTVRNLRQETPGVFTIDATFNDSHAAAAYRFEPGQFNMLYMPGVGESAISIAGYDEEQCLLQHTIRNVGSVTGAIEQAGIGASIGLRGPFGTAWPVASLLDRDQAPSLIIAAGGLGLAPLRSVVSAVIANRAAFEDVSLLVGARTPADLLYVGDYEGWQRAGIRVQPTVDRASDAWKGTVGVVTLPLERLSISDPVRTFVLACGPEVMMRYTARTAMARGIPIENIWISLERNMNCAVGLCGHCQLGPEFICKDGPVFRYDRIRPWISVRDF